MGITQLGAVKRLPYISSNLLCLLTVFPLAVAIICFVNVFKRLLNNRMLVEAGEISYEIYLVHGFTLGLVDGSLFGISMFIVVTVVLAFGVKKMNQLILTLRS